MVKIKKIKKPQGSLSGAANSNGNSAGNGAANSNGASNGNGSPHTIVRTRATIRKHIGQ